MRANGGLEYTATSQNLSSVRERQMTLVEVSKRNIHGILIECECGAVLVLNAGERASCPCGAEYYCDFELRIWKNVVRVA